MHLTAPRRIGLEPCRAGLRRRQASPPLPLRQPKRHADEGAGARPHQRRAAYPPPALGLLRLGHGCTWQPGRTHERTAPGFGARPALAMSGRTAPSSWPETARLSPARSIGRCANRPLQPCGTHSRPCSAANHSGNSTNSTRSSCAHVGASFNDLAVQRLQRLACKGCKLVWRTARIERLAHEIAVLKHWRFSARTELDFTRFRRHISTSVSELFDCQRAQSV